VPLEALFGTPHVGCEIRCRCLRGAREVPQIDELPFAANHEPRRAHRRTEERGEAANHT